MKLNDYSKLTATLVLKSGLHIGTGEKTGAGEPSPILISRRTELPYIPGSSIKGRMRCLLEQTYEDNLKKNPNDSGSVCFCGKCQICYLFGGGDAQIAKQPTRLLFRDSYLKEESESIIEKKGLEEKPGIRIDRSTGKSPKGAFFFVERVPEGCKFELEIAVRVFDGDNTEGVQQWLAMGLYLMEKDAKKR